MSPISDSAVHNLVPGTPQVDFLYFEGCPAHEPALALLREVIHDLGAAVEVRVFRVETAEEAAAQNFPGSPTIRVDGTDIEEGAALPPALACRAYRQTDGSISGLPPRDLIVAAIRRVPRWTS